MTKVSVLITSYNNAEFLDQRIRSVLGQTYSDFEIIILDDASTDNSRDIIENYRDHPKVFYINYDKKNSGSPFGQWKNGIRLARGEWIWIAESDDWCESNFLEELMSMATLDDKIVLCYCQSVIVGDKHKILGETKAEYLEEVLDGSLFIKKKMLMINDIMNVSMAIFKKDAFNEIPEEYESMKYCGDWLFWIYISLKGKVYISGKYLNYFRRHAGNVTSEAIRQGLDFIEGRKIFSIICENVELSETEVTENLQQKVNYYFERRSLFADKIIDKNVVASLVSVSPLAKDIISKKIKTERIGNFKSYLKRIFS
jgi:glycosyltransferase involved in cell wall biosynthesis